MLKNLTCYSSIARNRTKEKDSIRLGTENLPQKEFPKYLGVHIDKNLSWYKHIQMTNSKIIKGISILRTMRSFLQEEQLRDLHSSSIKPSGNFLLGLVSIKLCCRLVELEGFLLDIGCCFSSFIGQRESVLNFTN